MENALHRFVRLLRLRGVRISIPEALDAMAGAGQPGMMRNREQLRAALRAALIKDRRDDETFDVIFDRFFALVKVGGNDTEDGHGRGHGHEDLSDEGALESFTLSEVPSDTPQQGHEHGKPVDIREFFDPDDLAPRAFPSAPSGPLLLGVSTAWRTRCRVGARTPGRRWNSAVVAGGVAVLITLAVAGPIPALVIAGIVIADTVMQLEGTSCSPSCSGVPCSCTRWPWSGDRRRAAGIPGALLGVALPAILNSGIRSLLSDADEHVCPTDVFTAPAAAPRGRPRHPHRVPARALPSSSSSPPARRAATHHETTSYTRPCW